MGLIIMLTSNVPKDGSHNFFFNEVRLYRSVWREVGTGSLLKSNFYHIYKYNVTFQDKMSAKFRELLRHKNE